MSQASNDEAVEAAVLRDGGSVLVRPLFSLDGADVRAFFSRLSAASSRSRFFGRTTLGDGDVLRMTAQASTNGAALGAFLREGTSERLVAIGEIVDSPKSSTTVRRAEFAVAILDAHQGRGIGTLLLERLARIAKHWGFEELEADVMGDNVKMLEVFAKSGFQMKESIDGGVLHLVFPLIETERFMQASLERERVAARESVRVFFEPQSVAVVGASRREGTIGRALVDNLVSTGFRGPIYPVNPSASEIAGLRAYPDLVAIGNQVDLVVVAVPAPAVEAVVEDCARVRARGVVVISSGFAEASVDGRADERRLCRLVRSSGMRLVGPNCMGVLNADPNVSLNATFAPNWPPSGNVSMLSQSGALGIAMLDYARDLNIGIAGFVSIGNRADVSSNDLLAYWGDDPNTGVIVLYLESIGNSRMFSRLAPEVARKKPIVAVKSGRSTAGTRAASSHSAALASLDLGVDALFAQAGVIRTNTLEELFDVVALLSTQPPPRGPRVGVVTNAGGPGILLADACEAQGLALPQLSLDTVSKLKEFLPPQAGFSNPIDMIASATAEQYERAVRVVGEDPNVDSLVVVYIPPLVTKPEEVAAGIARGAGAVPADKPIASVFLSSKGAPAVLSGGKRGKIPSYSFPENAAIALSSAFRYARFRERPKGTSLAIGRGEEREIRAIVDRALGESGEDRTWLSTEDLATVLALAGVSFAQIVTCGPSTEAVAEASSNVERFPVVLKAVARGLVHKTEVGAVALGLDGAAALGSAAAGMRARVEGAGYALEGFLIQRQIEGGIEALVGVTTDPSLGAIVIAGLGGVGVELIRDVAFRLPPVSDVDAMEMLDGLKTKRIFDGFRGAPPGDRAALADVICRVSALVEILPELTDLNLNPVKVFPPGQGAVVVDGRLRLARRPEASQ